MTIDKDHLNRLITAKQLLQHGKSHLDKKSNFDISIAILHIDHVLEYLLKTVVSYKGIEFRQDEDSISLKTLYIEVRKNLNHRIPSFAKFSSLRIMRNQIQHDRMLQFNEVEIFHDRIENLFKEILKIVFSLDYETLDIEDFIEDTTIKIMVKSSKNNWESGKKNQAIANLRDAFDNAKRNYLYKLFFRSYMNLDNLMVKRDVEGNMDYRMLYTFKHIIESSTLSSLGIDVIKYETYEDLIDYLPKEFHADYMGGGVMYEDEEYTKEQYIFIQNFVIDAINIMQEKKAIDGIKLLHKKPREWKGNIAYKPSSTKINLKGRTFEIEGKNAYISTGLVPFEMNYGFEVTKKEEIKHIKSLKIGDSADDNDTITGIYYYIITNKPHRWHVCISIYSGDHSSTMLEVEKQIGT